MVNHWQRNILITSIVRICRSLMFAVSVITLFWKSYGMNLFDIFLLQAIFAVAIAVFEIPTGFIGDQLGRKKTFILSSFIIAAGWIIYSCSDTFWQFIIVEVTLGLGFSFISGTDSSLIYESLYEEKKADSFVRVEGRQLGFAHTAEAVSALVGGFLAPFLSVNILMLLSACAAGIGLALCFGITEPSRRPYRHPRGTLYGLYKIGRYVFLRSRIVRFALPLMAACGLSTMLGVWLYQPLWQERNIPLWLFGVLWAGMSLPSSLTGYFAHTIEKKVGKKLLIRLLPFPAVIGYICIALVPGWGAIAFIYMVPLLRGLTFPILSKYVHEETFSDKRATVLSIQSWLFRIAYCLTGPLVGAVGERWGLSWAFIACAAISLLATGLFIPGLAGRIDDVS
ncbi:MAG: MFS transporter [Spirochaetales bacterium]|nr:MFS transporter [Spirochaetales bacterium]